jgi:branched-chain amino acid transport system substrate-binding protein
MFKTMKRRTAAAIALSSLLSGTAFAADPMRIGFIESMTGPFSVNGLATAFAVSSEVDPINSEGGLLGRQLVPVTRDAPAIRPRRSASPTNCCSTTTST